MFAVAENNKTPCHKLTLGPLTSFPNLTFPVASRILALSEHTTAAMAENDRPGSPPPEERERLDKEAKQKEQEEQSKLPYKWTQTIGDVDLSATIPANIKGKDLDVKITKTSLKAGIKGQEPIIDVRRTNPPDPSPIQQTN